MTPSVSTSEQNASAPEAATAAVDFILHVRKIFNFNRNKHLFKRDNFSIDIAVFIIVLRHIYVNQILSMSARNVQTGA